MSVTCVAPNGATFSNSWWDWRPLAEYCFKVYPKLEATNHFRHWETNDGALNAAEAHALGWALWREVDSGATLKYLQERRRRIEAIPDQPCKRCLGTGVRHHTRLTAMMREAFGEPVEVGEAYMCDVCGGLGAAPPTESLYFFSVENVAEFSHFCRASDGFEVT